MDAEDKELAKAIKSAWKKMAEQAQANPDSQKCVHFSQAAQNLANSLRTLTGEELCLPEELKRNLPQRKQS